MVDPEDLDTRLREILDAKNFILEEWDHRAKHALGSIMPGGDITTEVVLKVACGDLQRTDTVFESFLPHDVIKTYLTGPETQTALRQIAKYFKPKDRKTFILYFTDPRPDCPPWLAIATIGGNRCRVQFYLQDGPLRSPPPWVGALIQGVQVILSSQDVEFFYHIPEAEVLLPKDFGLQLIKLVRSTLGL
ncbi:hypothetical protein F25303_444 [Fusarium sp. NRRL 25303]|nr:hypothetical protein F25303_444 [Fusarium sp. NRRL 25303]